MGIGLPQRQGPVVVSHLGTNKTPRAVGSPHFSSTQLLSRHPARPGHCIAAARPPRLSIDASLADLQLAASKVLKQAAAGFPARHRVGFEVIGGHGWRGLADLHKPGDLRWSCGPTVSPNRPPALNYVALFHHARR